MDKRYYTSTEVMDMFGLAPNNYTSFGKTLQETKASENEDRQVYPVPRPAV